MSSTNTTSMNTSTKKTVKKATAPAVPPVEVAVPVANPPPSADSKKSNKKKVVEAVTEEAPKEDVKESVPEPTFEDELKILQDELGRIRDATSTIMGSIKKLLKRHTVDVKEARKNRRSKRSSSEEGSKPSRPNNFEIPVPISDELSAFFGGEKNATMSRAAVNKAMSEYIKKNNLGQGQTINPDSALRKLLNVTEEEKVTIFNIQKFLKRHYPQTAKA